MTFKHDIVFLYLPQDKEPAEKMSALVAEYYSVAPDNSSPSTARTVAVLYRKKWGASGSSKKDLEALTQRAQKKGGWSFVEFIFMENLSAPEWMPVTQTWFGFDKTEIPSVSTVLKSRILRYGGTSENPVQKAERFLEREVSESKRAEYLQSPKALDDARKQLDKLFDLLKNKAERLKGYRPVYIEEDLNYCAIGHEDIWLRFEWVVPNDTFDYTVEDCFLQVLIYKKCNEKEYLRYFEDDFHFYRDTAGLIAWSDGWEGIRVTEQLVNVWVREYVEFKEETEV